MAESELVLYEVDERVAVITLNRPDKANAQTPAMLDQIDACFTRAAADREVRVIVLQANGKLFLVNQNGVLFGRDAQVDVGSLVGSTLDIRDDDFLAGRLRFAGPQGIGASASGIGR